MNREWDCSVLFPIRKNKFPGLTTIWNEFNSVHCRRILSSLDKDIAGEDFSSRGNMEINTRKVRNDRTVADHLTRSRGYTSAPCFSNPYLDSTRKTFFLYMNTLCRLASLRCWSESAFVALPNSNITCLSALWLTRWTSHVGKKTSLNERNSLRKL